MRHGPEASAGIPRWRLLLLVVLLAAGSYANAVGNGWAYDDEPIIRDNPVVTGPLWKEAVAGPYWSAGDLSRLYRPVTLTALAAQWSVFGNRPQAFHAVSVILHALVSVLVTLLLFGLVPPVAAAVGGALFATHPVHVEAVANVVGQAELLAAAAYLSACLLYLWGRNAGAGARSVRLLAIAVLYAVGLGAKEIAVTLPAMLLALELAVPPGSPGAARERAPWRRALDGLRREAPLHLVLGAILLAYLGARLAILGSVQGEEAPAAFAGLGAGGRILTALSLWPTYLRLLLFPLDLAADYAPAVLLPATDLRGDVLLGAAVLAGLVALAVGGWRRAPGAALAAAWLGVAILPVSHLVIPAGTVLGERTLYLPSVALSVAAAVALGWVWARHPARRLVAGALAAVAITAFTVRSALRNPSWLNTYTVMNTLALEHPESWLGREARAKGLVAIGDTAAALREYEIALDLLPARYALLCEVGALYKARRELARAEALLTAAVAVDPARPVAYRVLAELYLIAGDGRRAHGTALAGLARWGTDRELWAILSESYVAKGDLAAAARARRAALGADPASEPDRARLAELLAAQAAVHPPTKPPR